MLEVLWKNAVQVIMHSTWLLILVGALSSARIGGREYDLFSVQDPVVCPNGLPDAKYSLRKAHI